MGAHVDERFEPLGRNRSRVLGVTTGVAVEIEEETELNGDAAAGAVAVPRAVPGGTAARVDVDRVITARDRAPDHLADLRLDGGDLRLARGRRGGVHQVAAVTDGRADLSVRPRVLAAGGGVVRPAVASVERIHACDLVAGERRAGPARPPEDRGHRRARHDGAAVPRHQRTATAPRGSGLARAMHTEHRRLRTPLTVDRVERARRFHHIIAVAAGSNEHPAHRHKHAHLCPHLFSPEKVRHDATRSPSTHAPKCGVRGAFAPARAHRPQKSVRGAAPSAAS